MASPFSRFQKPFHLIFALILLCTLIAPYNPVQAQSSITNHLLIRFQPETTDQERQAVLATLDVTPVRWLPQANVVEARMNQPEGVFAAGAMDTVAPYVDYVEPDVEVVGDLAPNDPAFAVASQVYGQEMVEAPRAWDMSTGSPDTIIAILDSGINPDHPEFAGKLLPGYDAINDDDEPTDDHGHGTHVSGIAAAALNNEQGSAGICPQCRILPVKVLDSGNKGTWGTVAAGIYFAVDHGARVINLSLGATVSSHTLEDAVAYAEAHDVIVVASSGNAASSTPYYPAALPYVVAVGATNDLDTLWILSNTGDHIDLTAPGYRIYSTYYNLDANGGYTTMSGTSMASPFVTGLIGLVASFAPELTGSEIVDLITANADDLGDAGKDPQYGYGRINVYRTLVAANGGVEPPPAEEPTQPEQPVSPLDSAVLYLPMVNRG